MGPRDMERQALNVFRMRLLGAEVRPVHSGTATLKDATSGGHPRLGHERGDDALHPRLRRRAPPVPHDRP